jgi:hypothetical protein
MWVSIIIFITSLPPLKVLPDVFWDRKCWSIDYGTEATESQLNWMKTSTSLLLSLMCYLWAEAAIVVNNPLPVLQFLCPLLAHWLTVHFHSELLLVLVSWFLLACPTRQHSEPLSCLHGLSQVSRNLCLLGAAALNPWLTSAENKTAASNLVGTTTRVTLCRSLLHTTPLFSLLPFQVVLFQYPMKGHLLVNTSISQESSSQNLLLRNQPKTDCC